MGNIEYEVKIKVDDLESVKERLKDLGAKMLSHVLEEDYYVDLRKCPGFPKEAALRIRKSINKSTGEVRGKITFKKLSGQGDIKAKVRLEIESGVDKPDELIKAFMEMGFLIRCVRKERMIYKAMNDVVVTLDNVEGLGKFVEIELMNPVSAEYFSEKLNEVLSSLNLTGKKLITKPYIEMLCEGWRP